MALRRATNVYAAKAGFWIFAEWRVHTNKREFYRFDRARFEKLLAVGAPVLVAQEPGKSLWMVGSEFYWDADNLSAEDVGLLVWDRARRQDAKLDRLRKIRVRADDIATSRREQIPDDVRAFVWERDQARCVRCGADEHLQFDHVIPVAKGGGNSPQNIQLLCQDCNRQKSDSIV